MMHRIAYCTDFTMCNISQLTARGNHHSAHVLHSLCW